MTNATLIVQHLGDAWPILLLAIPVVFFPARTSLDFYLPVYLAGCSLPHAYYYRAGAISLPAARHHPCGMLVAIASGEGLRQLVQKYRSLLFSPERFTWLSSPWSSS
jgi:hypothetical protein